jgi:hypothetical protein
MSQSRKKKTESKSIRSEETLSTLNSSNNTNTQVNGNTIITTSLEEKETNTEKTEELKKQDSQTKREDISK